MFVVKNTDLDVSYSCWEKCIFLINQLVKSGKQKRFEVAVLLSWTVGYRDYY